jgi:hypothetical protein
MEKTIEITACDICGREEQKSYRYLQDCDWTKYKYQKDWKSGIHRGEIDVELCVCNRCDMNKKTMRFFLSKIKEFCV